jgi:hypothetical protein
VEVGVQKQAQPTAPTVLTLTIFKILKTLLIVQCEGLFKNDKNRPNEVAPTCNPSYSGGRDQED